ncbi:FAD-dependent monooxygenase [Myxococcus sp. AM009]|uniref:FAD-dependent monooxygenase n=1 Tax=unclassified Myxococcus TaxID=2648731 RepID=UPI0015952672|nr:FAD-dependent monooxygenase [Myxococcus sp. AM009]NVJ14858.1 FAD-dependent monooxygenase [Myxococcus sp. AM010]
MSLAPKVIIVGAGPTGLALAADLAGAGIPCRVLERRAQRSSWSRAFGITPYTMQLLDMRGVADTMAKHGLPWRHGPLGDGKSYLDFGMLDSRFPYMLIIPQNRTEDVLEEWARQSGADIIRGAQVMGLEQDAAGVTLQVEGPNGPWTERASFVVGCDGVRSAVRSLAGVPFHGMSYDGSLITADVHLKHPPNPPVHARTCGRGTVAVFPYGDGTFRLVVLDRKRLNVPVEQPVTLEEIQESVTEILRMDLGIHEALWMSRFRSDQRQAERYRVGRVLLAGDAAHTHIPSGGQGLQVGIQDAINLGWKLKAELEGWAPEGLLDSYEQERHPIAAATLRKTDLVYKYEISSAAPLRFIRWLIMQTMKVKAFQLPVVKELTGQSLRYPPPRGADAHAMVGRGIPDAHLEQGGEASRVYELLRTRRFVLVDQTPEGLFAACAGSGWEGRLDVRQGKLTNRKELPAALLIRPDGIVAWAPTRTGTHGLRAALRQWCGDPLTHDAERTPPRVAARA